ncbi:GMC family oxidoreductase [Rhodonellum psychrophilum GCM71 = DSM 17998]|uniref:GMC family oxidoreductase n=2 Tax=Rhodonellum TaxID=336827 RepID=U5C0W8_9BACT|nr:MULTISPECIES: GMC family oxidoreductase [Rhodonellum]ERM83723.1 GMC family oxidoreductase [Rhodonellum psychrophilum GCM71 = DSM 17998]SDY89745.1 Choline dehydrogenase [Rhodonellum ikkaensis]
MENIRFDAIVIGSGISGGWAAKELCEKGLKTLVLERGPEVRHLKDYPTMNAAPWEMPHRNSIPLKDRMENPVVNKCYAYKEDTQHFFVKDKEHPYLQDKPFDWVRGYQVGGKSLIWARQTQRWSKFDFEGPARDGYAVDWPIRYADLAPWYSHVERFVGISGNYDGLETLPDGEFLPAWEMNCVEKEIQKGITENFSDRDVIIGRCAHLTAPKKIHLDQGRGRCMARNQCYRGCPFGAYFSSNASTLPAAEKTGNLTLRTDAVVHSLIYDDDKEKVKGVRVVDRLSKETYEYFAPIVFLNAGALNTNLILMNSTSKRFPNGLGNDHDLLGKYIAFHNYRGSITARMPGFEDRYDFGRRPTAVMMPNFRNVEKQETDFLRGYMTFYTAGRAGWGNSPNAPFGAAFKEANAIPGNWGVYMMMQGETIPKASNQVTLSPDKLDEWGIPLLKIDVSYDDNDEKILQDFFEQGEVMLSKAGCIEIRRKDSKQAPGLDIHEMGGVRMGKDLRTSMLNGQNQLHLAPNVFVTDGACMTSTGTQNPSLTYMALTARAVDYATKQFYKGEFK